MRFPSSLLLLFLAWHITAITGQSCSQFYAYNASGQVSVPFPQPPIPHSSLAPSGNYTLSTHLYYNPATSPAFNQTFTATNSSGRSITVNKFAYEGCFIIFDDSLSSPYPATPNHVNEPYSATCNAAISSKCMSQIVQSINSTAVGFSRQSYSAGLGRSCSDIASSLLNLPKKCSTGSAIFTGGLFTNNPYEYLQAAKPYSNCSAQNLIPNLPGAIYFPGSSAAGKKKYLKHLKSVTPVMTVVWNNASSNEGVPWAETRLFCVSADKVVPGSESPSAASLTSQVWSAWYLAMLSGISSLVTFVL